jgi:hypothetical protein
VGFIVNSTERFNYVVFANGISIARGAVAAK